MDRMMMQQQASQEPLDFIAEKRKWTTEIENKRRQLEDDRRNLQHLKTKALRERWLLEGAPSTGQDQDHVKTLLLEDETKTRNLEETIHRLEQELLSLESVVLVQTPVMPRPEEEFKVHQSPKFSKHTEMTKEVKVHPSPGVITPREMTQYTKKEVKVHHSPGVDVPREISGQMKKAVYSVEIKVERDKHTGETRVLSTNTTLPVDLSHQGTKVYEDEQKVVHEMNGDEGLHLLSSSEVEELINKADEASMISQTVATEITLPTAEFQEEAEPQPKAEPEPEVVPLHIPAEITGLETKPPVEPNVAEASAENPVTMVFMGYQNVEDEDQTKKVLGLQGTVRAEVVVIEDVDEKNTPGREGGDAIVSRAQPAATYPPACTISTTCTSAAPSAPPPPNKPAADEKKGAVQVEDKAEQVENRVVELKKEKYPCKCCTIM